MTTQEARIDAIRSWTDDEPAAIVNDYEVPDNPAAYLVVEFYEGELVWAADFDTMEQAARYMESSDTDRTSEAVIELDTGRSFRPVWAVQRWFEDKSGGCNGNDQR